MSKCSDISSVFRVPRRCDFAVPFTHRLLFTEDVLAVEPETLLSLLESSSDVPPRVQFWLDEAVLASDAGVGQRINGFLAQYGALARAAGVYTITGGEEVKNDWWHVERVLEAINAAELDRRSYIVAIGGGAMLDTVGFAAATAHRGIRLVRLPTTTLAQADSGLGVKNAVNRFGKKNWLGTFAVPWAVVNDTKLLATLPDRHFRAGFSEAVKVTLLKSAVEFDRLCINAPRIYLREREASSDAIRVSAGLHLAHIATGGDPFETLEARPLDFGHWSAHRLETLTRFTLSHGEAVAIGVALDSAYSSLRCGLPAEELNRVLGVLTALGLPVYHEALDASDALFSGIEEFRQHLGGRLTLTMLRGVGDPIEVHSVDIPAMEGAIKYLHSFAQEPHSATQREPAVCNVRKNYAY